MMKTMRAVPHPVAEPDHVAHSRHIPQRLRSEPSTELSSDARSDSNKWIVLAIVATGAFMANLDASIVTIGLPAIARTFGVLPTGAAAWVISVYLLVIGALLLSVGRLADMVGRKRIWVIGLSLFTLGSALCGAAPALMPLILARVLQGLGAAMVMTLGPALLTRAFPPTERGRALGCLAVAVALGASAGPTAGGLLTTDLSWRWIFWVNVPIGVAGIGASALVLVEREQRGEQRFDLRGALLLATGLVALTLGLSFGQSWGWASLPLITTLAVTPGALAALLYVERRARHPLMSAALLRNRPFLVANASLLLSVMGIFAVSFLVPVYLEVLRQKSALEAGMVMSALPLTLALVAPVSGALADRFGTRWLAVGGLTLAMLGLLLLSQMDARASMGNVVLCLVVTGMGQGLFQAPNYSTIMGVAPREHQASAAGFLATCRVVGQSLSVAMASAIVAAGGGSLADHGVLWAGTRAGAATLSTEHALALQAAFMQDFHAVFLAAAALVAFGCVAQLWNR